MSLHCVLYYLVNQCSRHHCFLFYTPKWTKMKKEKRDIKGLFLFSCFWYKRKRPYYQQNYVLWYEYRLTYKYTHKWMHGWMDRWMDGRTDEWMDGLTVWRTDGRIDGQTDGQTDGWVDGWMNWSFFELNIYFLLCRQFFNHYWIIV